MRYFVELSLLLAVASARMAWRGLAGWETKHDVGICMSRHREWESPSPNEWSYYGAVAVMMAVEDVIKGKDKGSTYRCAGHIFMNAMDSESEVPASMAAAAEEFSKWSREVGAEILLVTSVGIETEGAKGKRSVECRPVVQLKMGEDIHLIAAVEPMTTEELFMNIKNAEKGVPSFNSKVARTDNFNVEWVSYSYNNVNRDLTNRWFQQVKDGTFAEKDLTNMIDEYAKYRGGYKFCLNLIVGKGRAIDPDHLDETLGVAVHGEIYFNTYGAVDGQCNDYYSCMKGGCDGVNV